uniref:Uncharacterized protein n=1 Tax=Sphingobacterium sp. (strain 21) TaxID=743722 RepID=F4CEJ7_SPHS2
MGHTCGCANINQPILGGIQVAGKPDKGFEEPEQKTSLSLNMVNMLMSNTLADSAVIGVLKAHRHPLCLEDPLQQ